MWMLAQRFLMPQLQNQVLNKLSIVAYKTEQSWDVFGTLKNLSRYVCEEVQEDTELRQWLGE